MKTLGLVLALVLLEAAPAVAQHIGWDQEYPTNPAPLWWRAYFDRDLPTATSDVVRDVACVPPATGVEWQCEGTLAPRTWTSVYITVENAFGESLPSNVIAFQLPITSVPAAPKRLRHLPYRSGPE